MTCDNVKIKCDMFYKTFTSVIKLNNLTETVHGILKNQCDMFSKTFTSITKLNEHTKTVHGTENQCYICSEIFVSTKELNSHKKITKNTMAKICLSKLNISREIHKKSWLIY